MRRAGAVILGIWLAAAWAAAAAAQDTRLPGEVIRYSGSDALARPPVMGSRPGREVGLRPEASGSATASGA